MIIKELKHVTYVYDPEHFIKPLIITQDGGATVSLSDNERHSLIRFDVRINQKAGRRRNVRKDKKTISDKKAVN